MSYWSAKDRGLTNRQVIAEMLSDPAFYFLGIAVVASLWLIWGKA